MLRLNFRIGTKLNIAAGLGVLLVAGMLGNELIGNQQIAESNRLVMINTANKGNAQTADAAMARARTSVRDIINADTEEQLARGVEGLRTAIAEGGAQIDAAAKRATRQVMQEFYRETRGVVDGYLAVGNELAAAQKAGIDAVAKRSLAVADFTDTLRQLLESNALAGAPNRGDLDLMLRDASAWFNAAHAAGWRFAAMAEPEQKDMVTRNTDLAVAALKRAREAGREKETVSAV